MTHTIEGDNIHFTFISPEGKQRKITLSLSEDGELINQILAIKDRTSREAALGYLFVNGQQEPRSETQLLSLTDPKQDILTIQDLQNQINSMDGLIDSLKEKLQTATPEQKKEYAKRIKELEKDKKRLQQQMDLIKNKNNGRTQSTSNIEQLLMIASNPEPSTISKQFKDFEQFKEFLDKVKQDLSGLNIDPASKMSNLVQSLQDKMKQMEVIYADPKLKSEEKNQQLKELQKIIQNLWNDIETAGKEFNELQQDLKEKEKVLNEGVEKVDKLATFLKEHPVNEELTKDNLKEILQFVIDNLNEETKTDSDFRSKIADIIYKLNLNGIKKELNQQDPKFYYGVGKRNLTEIARYDFMFPTNLGYNSDNSQQLHNNKKTEIKSWGYITNINKFKKDNSIHVDDLPWNIIKKFIDKCKEVSPPPFTNIGFQFGLGFNSTSEPLGGFKDMFTSKKVKENIQSNIEDIKSLKSEITDLKEELKEIKYLLTRSARKSQNDFLKNQQQPQRSKNFQNYLKDIENITMNKLKHVEPKQRMVEPEQNEIAKKILDRRIDIEPDYSTDDDEPWDD